jgi:hypothetical protein
VPAGVLAPAPDASPAAAGPGAAGIGATEALVEQDPDVDVLAGWFEDHASTVEEVKAAVALPEAPDTAETEDSLAVPLTAEQDAVDETEVAGTEVDEAEVDEAETEVDEPAAVTESVETGAPQEPEAGTAAVRDVDEPTARTPALPLAAAPRIAQPEPRTARTEPPVAPAPAREAVPATTERDPRRRRFLLIGLAALVLLLLLALIVPALVRGALDPATGPTTAPSGTTQASAPARSAAASPSPSPSATTTPTASASPSPTASASSSASAKPKTKATSKAKPKPKPKPAPVAATSPSAALRTYYGLLPGNRDAAWDRLTSHFKDTTAGPRSYFDSFWGGVSSVSVSNIGPDGSREATATVTLHFTNGSTEVDRSKFWFVESGGILKIDRQQNQ